MEISFQCNLKFLESFDIDVIKTECYKDSAFCQDYLEFLLLNRSCFSPNFYYKSSLLQSSEYVKIVEYRHKNAFNQIIPYHYEIIVSSPIFFNRYLLVQYLGNLELLCRQIGEFEKLAAIDFKHLYYLKQKYLLFENKIRPHLVLWYSCWGEEDIIFYDLLESVELSSTEVLNKFVHSEIRLQ